MLLFQWIRSRVCNAILAGVSDALAQLGDDQAEGGDALAVLRERLAAPPAEAPVEGQPAARNGRRRVAAE